MKAIINGQILMDGRLQTGRALLFDRRILAAVDAPPEGAEVVDACGGYVSPGLIDVHCHGFGGREAGDVGAGELLAMSRVLPSHGVTAWLPTVSCLKWDRYEKCFADIAEASRASLAEGFQGARNLGAHAEGPFLNAEKCGAQDPEYIVPPDWRRLKPLLGCVRLMTVAPEAEGATELIRNLAGAGVTVSIGHTTADYAQAVAGIEAGVTHATHTFNAMPSLLHRKPGAISAVLNDRRVFCELIADGFHVHPSLITLVARMKGDRLVLITDSIRFSGLANGQYTLGGQTVTVQGVACRLPDGTIAGSTLTLDRAVRNARDLGGLSVAEALAAASANAAASVGEGSRGSLMPGFEADIAVFDAELQPARTFVGGVEVWRA